MGRARGARDELARATTTTREVTRILVQMDDDVVLQAGLLPCYWGPHRRALTMLLVAMALWHQAAVRAVVSARLACARSSAALQLLRDLPEVCAVSMEIDGLVG